MEVRDFQARCVDLLKKWEKKRGVTPGTDHVFIHLTEEIGELAAQYINQKERKEKYSFEEVENALGDILIQLFRLADLHGLDMEMVIEKIIKEEVPVLDQ